MNSPTPLICVPICQRTLAGVAELSARAVPFADFIEIRVDCLEDLQIETVVSHLTDFLNQTKAPVILTLRPKEQGGVQEVTPETRLAFWTAMKDLPAFLDIEASLLPQLGFSQHEWSRVICSHHDFSGVPSDLKEIYERMKSFPASILKISVQANDITDCLPLFDLIERARRDEREIIAIAMGASGAPTRILGPSRGSFLTYGSLDEMSRTAQGQVTARELRDVYRIRKITPHTQVMGLVGCPTQHSISPDLHNTAFDTAGADAVYLRFEVRELAAFMKRMVDPRSREIDWNLKGLSITAPHKTEVMQYLDWVEPTALEIGAVNTVLIDEKGMRGFNTDAEALLKPLKAQVGTLAGTNCAIVGTGGAARTAAWALKQQGAQLTIFGRDPRRAEGLARDFMTNWSDLAGAHFAEFDVVINATPLGTLGPLEFVTVAKAEQLRGARLVYDLVYNPTQTQLLREAQLAGCETLGGISMLVNQALAQFQLWTGRDISQALMTAAAERALQRQSIL